MRTSERVYWDSDVFISFLQQEPGRYTVLRHWIERAENGEVQIVASAFSLCEVARVDDDLLPAEQEELIVEFFGNPYILIQQLDEFVAQRTRAIVRELRISAKDAVHIASAIQADVPVMHTYEKKLIAHSGKVGDPPLSIEEPRWKNDQPPLDGTLS
jgi:predicted nucleic acid-binding protein